MNPLLAAILNHQHDELRELCFTDRHLFTERSESGRLPLDVAVASGDVIASTILLREGAISDRRVVVDFDYLRRYFGVFGTRLLYWPHQFEYQLWRYVLTGELAMPPPRFPEFQKELSLHPETRNDLRFIADRSQRWAFAEVIVHEHARFAAVTLNRWEMMYAQWSQTT
jgi:hypothetical protein